MQVVEGSVTLEGIDEFVATLGEIGDEHGVAVQALDARYVVDRAHLERACELADRAFERGDAIARERAVEILLYAAGTRQINQALELGVSVGSQPAVVVVHGDGEETAAAEAVRSLSAVEPSETLGEYDPELVTEWFDIGDTERSATDASLSALVRERVTLLLVEK